MSAPRREVRRAAMQLLYQIDLRGSEDLPAIRQAMLAAESDESAFDPAEVTDEAMALADLAWRDHDAADAMATELAPDWPTYRQPPVDRAILRLAYHEMLTGRAPVKVAINEAVELAKKFGAEQSATFVNGVLDKMARRLEGAGDESV